MAHVLWIPGDGLAHLRGIAATLHDRAVDAMRDRGHRLARLHTPEPQARARRFYERRGWESQGVVEPLKPFGMPIVEYRLALG